MLDARRLFAVCIAIALAALVPPARAPRVGIAANGSIAAVHAEHLSAPVTVAVVPDAPHVDSIYEYFDPAYARGRAMSDRFAAGFATHLTVALAYRHYSARVERVDAAGLARVLGGRARGECVFVPGGILPDAVRSKGRDALRNWLSRGGLVVWAGAPFDAYYSVRGTADVPGGVRGPDTTPWALLYGAAGPLRTVPDIHSPPLYFGTVEAPKRAAIGLMFNLTTFPVDAQRLSKVGGSAIGYVDESGRSSISVFPVSAGRVVTFGDAVDNELIAAQEIAQIFLTGAWYEPRALSVGAHLETSSADTTIPVPNGKHLVVFGAPPYYFPFDN